MQLVGELINASRREIAAMIQSRDSDAVKAIARAQADHGVDYIDVNAGIFHDQESRLLQWLVQSVQSRTGLPCCIDSPNPAAIEAAAAVHRGAPLINSISLEKSRFDALIPLVAGTDWKIVALCIGNEGLPATVEDRLANAETLINKLVQKGVPPANIYVDPLVQPVATDSRVAGAFLKAVSAIMSRFEGVHTICGLSNISYGLPRRSRVNRAFAAMAIAHGLDTAIVNPLDRELTAVISAAEALTGNDPYCLNYIAAFREQRPARASNAAA